RNESLVWVHELQVGLVAPTVGEHPGFIAISPPGATGTLERSAIPAMLLPYIAAGQPVMFLRSQPQALAPYSTLLCTCHLPMPIHEDPSIWCGALYIVPSNGLPDWYSIRVDYYHNRQTGVTNIEPPVVVSENMEPISVAWSNQ